MPNVSRPSGFTPVSTLNGAPWNGQARIYSIAANYNTALYIGDPVISSGTADTNGIAGVALGAATGALRGVIVGLGTSPTALVNPNNLNQIYRPASDPAVWYAMVVDDPNVIFEIEEHTNGTAMSALDVGNNQISVVGTGNGFISGWTVASTTDAASSGTATVQLRLLGLAQKANNTFGAAAKWLVQINVHELGHGTGAAGV